MRRFEYVEGKSNKFWEVEQDSLQLNIRWGRVGTQGQSQTKDYADEVKAKAAMDKLILEKTGKGYVEVSVGADSQIGVTQTKVAVPAKSEDKESKKAGVKAEEVPVLVQTDVPQESDDVQADRAFSGILKQIIDGVFDSREVPITIARIRKDHNVGEMAAQQVFLRLSSAGLTWRYGTTSSLANNAKSQAKELLTSLSKLGEPSLAPHESLDNAPPWKQQPILRLLPEMARHALPSRRFPQILQTEEAAKSWLRARELFKQNVDLAIDGSDAALQGALKELSERLETRKMDGSLLSDGLLVAMGLSFSYRDDNLAKNIIAFLEAKHGLPYLIDAYLEAQLISVVTEYQRAGGQVRYKKTFSQVVNAAFHEGYYGPMNDAEWLIRQYLSSATEEIYKKCVEKAQAAIPGIHPTRQAQVALLFPDEPEMSNEIALRLGGNSSAPQAVHWLMMTASSPEAIKAVRKIKSDCCFWEDTSAIATLLQERGVEALDILLEGASYGAAGTALTCIGLPDAIEGLARAASSSKEALARYSQAISRWPAAAMAALAHLVAINGKEASIVMPGLLQLVRAHPDLLEQLLPWIEPASAQALQNLQARLAGPKEVASDEELPKILAAPPWLAKVQKKTAKALQLEVLPLDSIESWEEGEKAERTKIEYEYHRRRFEAVQKNTMLFLQEIRLENEGKNQGKNEQARKILEAGDGVALAELWLKMKAANKNGYWSLDFLCLPALSETFSVAFWNHLAGGALKLGSYFYNYEQLAAHYGLRILPGLMNIVSARPTENMHLMMNFGVVEMAPIAARAFAKLKSLREKGRAWLLKFPEHAIAGLIAPSVGKTGEARDCAAIALRLLVANGYENRILEMAARYDEPEVVEAIKAMLNEDPLDRFPGKRASLPEFWQPQGWNRPILKNGKALSNDSLMHIGTMLTFPTNDGLYAGIEQLKEACTPESLSLFMWDCFSAWLTAGAPSKDNWALTMQGYLGNDETARKLTPYIREWPGESAHARAVTALDVLANIGTDVALMLLNGIAQKVKFKGLQDKAREKIDAIAEARGLSTEELEDRLAPDLGLDEQGTLVLDFGPRQFKVGFDEALKPYVREIIDGREGSRLLDLPKPKKTDDENLSKESVDRFKLLKKDARTIASQQVVRLEVAMCTRRRWKHDLFRTFLALHPLVRHLVQRLVWGVYECDAESNYGGKLISCFRVGEDGSYTNAEDDAFDMSEGDNLKIGLPHALELPAEEAAAFGQLFADYELLQPFKQIGRDTYTLTDEEKTKNVLDRWKGVVVPTGRVLGLVNKGWRRGMAQDGGGIWYFTKSLNSGDVIELSLDPGIIVGMVNEYPEQTLQDIQVGKPSTWGEINKPKSLALLDSIEASELVRDMEQLRA